MRAVELAIPDRPSSGMARGRTGRCHPQGESIAAAEVGPAPPAGAASPTLPGSARGILRRPGGHPVSTAISTRPQGSVLSANRLADGAVVFLDFEGDWSDNLAAAVVARAPDERRALVDRARYEAERTLVVEPHLLDVDELDGRLIPIRRGTGRTEGRSAFADPGGARAASPLAWRPTP